MALTVEARNLTVLKNITLTSFKMEGKSKALSSQNSSKATLTPIAIKNKNFVEEYLSLKYILYKEIYIKK